MNPLLAAALEVQAFCRAQGWRFCFIGGLAVQRWGEPRLTQDADLTVITGFGNEAPFVDALLSRFERRLADAREFALENRVVLIRTCSAEDLIVFKAFAGRARDWLDIESIAIRQAARLNERLIWSELVPLLELKETPEDAERLRAVLDRARS